MKRILLSAALFSACTVFAAVVDEIDLSNDDDTAAAATGVANIIATQFPGVIDISCDDATVADILRQFRKATGSNIIAPDSTNLTKRISVSLKGVPWFEALESILNSRDFRIEKRNNIFYVVETQNKEITRSYILNHASAEDLADLFNGYKLKSEKIIDTNGNTENSIKAVESKFSALGGKVHASAFPNANVLVLSGFPSDLDECERIIKAIDRAATQVYIEARFLELSSEAKHELGVKWDSMKEVGLTSSENKLLNTATASRGMNGEESSLRDLFNNVGTMAATYSGTYSGTLTASDFSIFLSAFESVGGNQIFSNPKVIVSNGKEAIIDMTTKFPNVRVQANYMGEVSSRLQISAELEEIKGDKEKGLFAGSVFFSWGISLSVKPRISPEGLISVKITPSISERDTEFENDGFYHISTSGESTPIGKFPVIKMKSITTDFTMKDGCTAVIGGLTQTTEDNVDSGIPYLRKIPWIGPHFFGWKSREKVQKEIIICVTIGIANPQELPKDVGLPKNAVLGREYVEGRRQEPGSRPNAAKSVATVDTRPLEEIHEVVPQPVVKDEEIDLEEPVKAPEPVKVAEPEPVKVVEPKPEPVKVAEPKPAPAKETQPTVRKKARRH